MLREHTLTRLGKRGRQQSSASLSSASSSSASSSGSTTPLSASRSNLSLILSPTAPTGSLYPSVSTPPDSPLSVPSDSEEPRKRRKPNVLSVVQQQLTLSQEQASKSDRTTAQQLANQQQLLAQNTELIQTMKDGNNIFAQLARAFITSQQPQQQ